MHDKTKRDIGIAIGELAAVVTMAKSNSQYLDGLCAARQAIEAAENEIRLQVINDDIARRLVSYE